MDKILNYIDGVLVEPASGKFLENYDPSQGKVYSYIADSDPQDVDNAVGAASKAFESWATLPAEKRAVILQRIADLIDHNLDALALAESVDNGKPVRLAKTLD